jgi:hypothetical protein
MLTIRKPQMEVFSSLSRERLKTEAADQLRRYFPEFVQFHDPETLRAEIERAFQDCAAYGLATERDYRRFINLAAVYGWRFDRRPENVWMVRILSDANITNPGHRLDRLIQQCISRTKRRQETERILRQYGFSPEEPPPLS